MAHGLVRRVADSPFGSGDGGPAWRSRWRSARRRRSVTIFGNTALNANPFHASNRLCPCSLHRGQVASQGPRNLAYAAALVLFMTVFMLFVSARLLRATGWAIALKRREQGMNRSDDVPPRRERFSADREAIMTDATMTDAPRTERAQRHACSGRGRADRPGGLCLVRRPAGTRGRRPRHGAVPGHRSHRPFGVWQVHLHPDAQSDA